MRTLFPFNTTFILFTLYPASASSCQERIRPLSLNDQNRSLGFSDNLFRYGAKEHFFNIALAMRADHY